MIKGTLLIDVYDGNELVFNKGEEIDMMLVTDNEACNFDVTWKFKIRPDDKNSKWYYLNCEDVEPLVFGVDDE